MDKNTAQSSIKNLTSELFSLNPSSLLTLFEIDISQIGFDTGNITETEITLQKDVVFRFHNSINLTSSSVFWQGKEYIASDRFFGAMPEADQIYELVPQPTATVKPL